MRVENINTKNLLEKLEIVGNAIPSKTPMICLTSVYMKFQDNKIVLLGNDTTIAIKEVMFENEEHFEIKENGVCLVEYRIFKTILSKLNNATSVFYTKDNQFIIENGKSVYRLNLVDVEQYPTIEFKKLENEIEFKTIDNNNIINNVSLSCATSEKKPILTGVNFRCSDNTLTCVATDSFRLSQYTINFDNQINNTNFTFPKQSLVALNKIISRTKEETIKLLYNNSNEVLINIDNTLYKTRLLDGSYPDTSRLIPKVNEMVCNIDRKNLIETIDRIGVFKDIENNKYKV